MGVLGVDTAEVWSVVVRVAAGRSVLLHVLLRAPSAFSTAACSRELSQTMTERACRFRLQLSIVGRRLFLRSSAAGARCSGPPQLRGALPPEVAPPGSTTAFGVTTGQRQYHSFCILSDYTRGRSYLPLPLFGLISCRRPIHGESIKCQSP